VVAHPKNLIQNQEAVGKEQPQRVKANVEERGEGKDLVPLLIPGQSSRISKIVRAMPTLKRITRLLSIMPIELFSSIRRYLRLIASYPKSIWKWETCNVL
jgi:hypothetical protein